MPKTVKPPALGEGSRLRIVSPASACKPKPLVQGIKELNRRGYDVLRPWPIDARGSYCAGPAERRAAEFAQAFTERSSDAVICARGGYGSAAMLEHLRLPKNLRPKLLIGYSDITVLQAYLWKRFGWPSLYGPMVAAGWDKGAGHNGGFDLSSFTNAVRGMERRWRIPLQGETLVRGTATGIFLGGCVTLLENLIATKWDLDLRGAILLLEDLRVFPYQLDRMFLHLRQAGKLRGIRGIVLGDFPQYDSGREKITAFRDVCTRLLAPLGVPIVFGSPIGHTTRPMLTVPLGVRVKLKAAGQGELEILEPAVTPA